MHVKVSELINMCTYQRLRRLIRIFAVPPVETTTELEVFSLDYLYLLKSKGAQFYNVCMTRNATKLSIAILAPVFSQSAVNVATATAKCSITFLLRYDENGNVKQKQGNSPDIL